jgi:integrase
VKPGAVSWNSAISNARSAHEALQHADGERQRQSYAGDDGQVRKARRRFADQLLAYDDVRTFAVRVPSVPFSAQLDKCLGPLVRKPGRAQALAPHLLTHDLAPDGIVRRQDRATCPACGARASTWLARYRGPDHVERTRSFTRKVDAERFLVSQRTKIDRGEWVDPEAGRVTLDDWAGEWLADARSSLKPKTAASYESLLRSRILPELGRIRLAELTPSIVQAWINGMDVSASRVRQAHIVLALMLKAAVRDGRIARNVAVGTRLPRIERREAPYLAPEVVDQIAAAMPEPYDLFITILGTLGPRFGEGAALRRRSVDLLRRRLLIAELLAETGGQLTFGLTKTHAQRAVPLPRSIAQRLSDHLEALPADPEALLFTSPRGAPLRYSNFRTEVWQPTLERLKLPRVGLHVLRHSAAARMIAAGASPKAVQTILGHGSAAFTLTVYGHLFDADLDALADALDVSNAGPVRDQRGATVRAIEEK